MFSYPSYFIKTMVRLTIASSNLFVTSVLLCRTLFCIFTKYGAFVNGESTFFIISAQSAKSFPKDLVIFLIITKIAGRFLIR